MGKAIEKTSGARKGRGWRLTKGNACSLSYFPYGEK
jgi:hypothetical protein